VGLFTDFNTGDLVDKTLEIIVGNVVGPVVAGGERPCQDQQAVSHGLANEHSRISTLRDGWVSGRWYACWGDMVLLRCGTAGANAVKRRGSCPPGDGRHGGSGQEPDARDGEREGGTVGQWVVFSEWLGRHVLTRGAREKCVVVCGLALGACGCEENVDAVAYAVGGGAQHAVADTPHVELDTERRGNSPGDVVRHGHVGGSPERWGPVDCGASFGDGAAQSVLGMVVFIASGLGDGAKQTIAVAHDGGVCEALVGDQRELFRRGRGVATAERGHLIASVVPVVGAPALCGGRCGPTCDAYKLPIAVDLQRLCAAAVAGNVHVKPVPLTRTDHGTVTEVASRLVGLETRRVGYNDLIVQVVANDVGDAVGPVTRDGARARDITCLIEGITLTQ